MVSPTVSCLSAKSTCHISPPKPHDEHGCIYTLRLLVPPQLSCDGRKRNCGRICHGGKARNKVTIHQFINQENWTWHNTHNNKQWIGVRYRACCRQRGRKEIAAVSRFAEQRDGASKPTHRLMMLVFPVAGSPRTSTLMTLLSSAIVCQACPR